MLTHPYKRTHSHINAHTLHASRSLYTPRKSSFSQLTHYTPTPMYKPTHYTPTPGCQAQVKYTNNLSTTKQFPIGVPQESVLSPTLFNQLLQDQDPPPILLIHKRQSHRLTTNQVPQATNISSIHRQQTYQSYLWTSEGRLTHNSRTALPVHHP